MSQRDVFADINDKSFEHGIKINNKSEEKKDDNKGEKKKNFYFKLPADAKQYVNKQAKSLKIPKGVLTTNGPNSSDKNSDALSSNKSPVNGAISKSFNSQCSPGTIGSIGSNPTPQAATTTLFSDQLSNGNKKSNPLNKSFKKQVISNTNNSTLTKAPLVNNTRNLNNIINAEFYNRTLDSLYENEKTIKKYWNKKVLLSATTSKGEIQGKCIFNCCCSNGWISFDHIVYDKNPQNSLLTGTYAMDINSSLIDDIILIDEEKTNIVPKSIKNQICDNARLKLIENALYKLSIKHYLPLAPLNPSNRKLYLNPSVNYSQKQLIAQNICNLKIANNLKDDSVFTAAFQSAIYDNDITEYEHALSLLHDYHKMWIQYVQPHMIINITTDTEPTFNKSYIDWDKTNIRKLIKDQNVIIKKWETIKEEVIYRKSSVPGVIISLPNEKPDVIIDPEPEPQTNGDNDINYRPTLQLTKSQSQPSLGPQPMIQNNNNNQSQSSQRRAPRRRVPRRCIRSNNNQSQASQRRASQRRAPRRRISSNNSAYSNNRQLDDKLRALPSVAENKTENKMTDSPQILTSKIALSKKRTGWCGRRKIQNNSMEVFARKIRFTLNKITIANYCKLSKQLIDIFMNEIYDTLKLEKFITLIFEKAISAQEYIYTQLYVKLCHKLSSISMDFKDILFEVCKTGCAFDKDVNIVCKNKLIKHKRLLGTMRFIGQLYVEQLLPGYLIVTMVLKHLMRDNINSRCSNDIEYACTLLMTIYSALDNDMNINKIEINKYYEKLISIQRDNKYGFRISMLIQDLMNLRKHN